MRREDQLALAFVVGACLFATALLAFDQHCVRTSDRDLACRSASRVLSVFAPARY